LLFSPSRGKIKQIIDFAGKGERTVRRVMVIAAVCVLLSGVIVLPASAESAATRVDLLCTVNSDGDVLVSATVLLRLEAAYDDFFYPLPPNAKDINMNGSPAKRVVRTNSAANVDISKITRGYTGDASIRFEYTIPDAVRIVKVEESSKTDAKEKSKYQLQLNLPMLSGFPYPVESLSFTVTLPGSTFTSKPSFTSIYRQNSIEADLKWEVRGSQIIGSSIKAMNDREGMDMIMTDLPTTMFPGVSTYVREGNPELVPMIVFAVLALLYWLLFLGTLPLMPSASATPPAGITAGEMGCHLTLSGADLTGMVFSWAQMGYLLLYMDGNGRILLHKRMDMGNERSSFENKVFRALFGSRRVVEGTGLAYAQLSRKVAAATPGGREMYKRNNGNVKIFRLLACVSQILCGVCVAMNMTSIRALGILMAVILGIFGAVSGWLIQAMAYRTHLRGKQPVFIGLALILAWVLLGLLSGQVWIPLGCSVGEWAIGYFAAYGGRRSDLGRYDGSVVLGFRRYLKRLPNAEVSRILSNDPDYFFNTAPYALALGVIKPFARSFSRRKLDQCPYLMTRVHGKRTAEEWAQLMAQAADMLDARAKAMELEKFTAVRPALRRPRRA